MSSVSLSKPGSQSPKGITRGSSEREDVPIASLPDCVFGHMLCSQMDARTFCALSLVCNALRSSCTLCEETFFEALVNRRFGPIHWALPAGALRPDSRRSWRSHYFRLSVPGHEESWGVLASKHLSHDMLVDRGLIERGEESGVDCILVIRDTVYDVTSFAHLHPGMAASLHLFARSDATEAFGQVWHSPQALRLMRRFAVPGLSLSFDGCPTSLLGSDRSDRELSDAPRSSGASSERTSTQWAVAFLRDVAFLRAVAVLPNRIWGTASTSTDRLRLWRLLVMERWRALCAARESSFIQERWRALHRAGECVHELLDLLRGDAKRGDELAAERGSGESSSDGGQGNRERAGVVEALRWWDSMFEARQANEDDEDEDRTFW